MMSHHCFLLHISRMKADRNIISSVPGPLDMSSPWAMSISQTLGGLSEQISPLIAGFCLNLLKNSSLHGLIPYCKFINFGKFEAKFSYYSNEIEKKSSLHGLIPFCTFVNFENLPTCMFIPSCMIIR